MSFKKENLKDKTEQNQVETKKKGKHRKREEKRNVEGGASSNIYIRNKEKKNIKIGAHNINGIKGDNMKAEQLAEFGKSEGYNIIGIIETNIGEQEGK